MQRIEGLLPPKGISLTEEEVAFCMQQVNELGFKKFSPYIRWLVRREMHMVKAMDKQIKKGLEDDGSITPKSA